jgi:hypothetical protein
MIAEVKQFSSLSIVPIQPSKVLLRQYRQQGRMICITFKEE